MENLDESINLNKRSNGFLKDLRLVYSELEDLGILMVIYDEEGDCVYFNKVCEDLTGYQAGEIEGNKRINNLFVHSSKKIVNQIHSFLSSDFTSSLFEEEWICKDGSIVLIKWRNKRVYSDNNGFGYIISIGKDLTKCKEREDQVEQLLKERLQKEKELIKSAQQITNILENISDGFYSLDKDLRFMYANREAKRIFKHTETDLIGKSIWEVYPKIPEIYDNINKALETQEPVHFEMFYPLSQSWLEIHLYPSEEGLSFYSRDIKEKKQIEAEMTRLDRFTLIGQMASGIGHEIRNPMTTVRGFIQLLRNKKEYYQHRSHFDLMLEELDRANFIITQYLSLAGEKPLEKEDISLDEIVKEMFPLIQVSAYKKDNEVEIELNNTPEICLDKKEIRQLILNLAQNGLDAMEAGGILKIKTYLENEEVVLAVRDEGAGIEPWILESLGTPFLTTKEDGTGLGLATCYSVAYRHNARITVDTDHNGTSFYVRF